MHVVIRRFDHVTSVPHAARRAESGIGEVMRNCPGFRAYYVLQAGEHSSCSVTIFEDADTARLAHRKAMAFINASMVDLIQGEPEVIEGEVLVALGPRPAAKCCDDTPAGEANPLRDPAPHG